MSAAAVLRWRADATVAALPYAGLGPEHLLAIVQRESGGDPAVISKTGYRGLMQIGKAVTSDWSNAAGVSSPWPEVMDPLLNLRIGAWYLAWCRSFAARLGVAGDPWAWAMAVYGWGPGNVRSAVRDVAARLGRPPTIQDMERLRPDDGKPHVRPWYRARVYARDVARWRQRIEADPPAGPTVAAVLGLVILAGAVLAAGAALAWLVSR